MYFTSKPKGQIWQLHGPHGGQRQRRYLSLKRWNKVPVSPTLIYILTYPSPGKCWNMPNIIVKDLCRSLHGTYSWIWPGGLLPTYWRLWDSDSSTNHTILTKGKIWRFGRPKKYTRLCQWEVMCLLREAWVKGFNRKKKILLSSSASLRLSGGVCGATSQWLVYFDLDTNLD